MVVCRNCKLENKRGETRCAGCGTALPKSIAPPKPAAEPKVEAPPAPAAPAPAPPPPAPPPPAPVPIAAKPETPTSSLPRSVAPAKDESESTQELEVPTFAEPVSSGEVEPPPTPEAAPPDAAAEVGAVAWLHCAPLPPIPLVAGRDVTLGRKNCTIVIPHTEVSRHHATVKVAPPDRITISDNGSSNGTFVNGKQIAAEQQIRVGDSISIGPYTIEVWAVKDLPDEMEMTSAVPLTAKGTFSGKLAEMPLQEVLEALQLRQRTGTLLVADRQQRGMVVIEKGKVKEAAWGQHRSSAALNAMLELTFGSFSFTSE